MKLLRQLRGQLAATNPVQRCAAAGWLLISVGFAWRFGAWIGLVLAGVGFLVGAGVLLFVAVEEERAKLEVTTPPRPNPR